jgi:quercetin dioxygenase-like cupin family protein
VVLVLALSLSAIADELKPQPQRNILERHDQSGVMGVEIIIGTTLLPAGAAIGFHTHPGDELGFVLKGTFTLKTRGQPDRVLHAGDSFLNVRGAVHSVAADALAEGGTAVSTWIVDKDAPMATPVPLMALCMNRCLFCRTATAHARTGLPDRSE